ncbi:MAG: hypothetical protein MJZ41_10460, partial [Bacteroidaceae bacterium]|nr:hypothetical protein [Bacteroidaceae bacterium]
SAKVGTFCGTASVWRTFFYLNILFSQLHHQEIQYLRKTDKIVKNLIFQVKPKKSLKKTRNTLSEQRLYYFTIT